MAQGTEAFLSMVANEDLDLIPVRVEDLVKRFKTEWVTPEERWEPGSQEAEEAATVADRNRRRAIVAWRRMEPDLRAKMIDAASLALGPRASRSLVRQLGDE